jgi:hypothetical protein
MKIFFTYRTGYCGSDGHDCFEVEDDLTDEDLDEMAWEQAIEHASRYGYYLCDEECEDINCEYEHPGNTNISGSWEPYDAKKHDMKRPGGGKWFPQD